MFFKSIGCYASFQNWVRLGVLSVQVFFFFFLMKLVCASQVRFYEKRATQVKTDSTTPYYMHPDEVIKSFV